MTAEAHDERVMMSLSYQRASETNKHVLNISHCICLWGFFVQAEAPDFLMLIVHSHCGCAPNLPMLMLPRLKKQCQKICKNSVPEIPFGPLSSQSLSKASALQHRFINLSSCIISDFIPLSSFTFLSPST